MANAYHNLAGWLRDVKAVLGDEGYPLADSYYWELREALDQLVAATELDGDDEPVPEELESTDGDVDVPDDGPRGGVAPRSDTGRAGARSDRPMGRSARMADEVQRASRGQARRESAGDTADVAGAGCGLKRSATVEVPLAKARAQPTRANSRSSRKGVSRATRTPKKRSTRK